jgi:DNA repair exonuclease SbcCD nuclease subunit
MVKFIHAADLHLDTPFSGLEQTAKKLAEKLRQAPFESLEKIVDLALKEAVDFILLAGDLYNTERVNIKAQSLFIEQMERLENAKIAVFLIRGNHDYMTDEAHTLSLPLPKNVHTYPGEIKTHLYETKHKERVAVTGFSYDSQWVFERKIKDYPKRRQDVDLHIGLLHGSLEGIDSKEGNYAPFTTNELQQKNYDYWALGHIHQRQQISKQPPAYYPGNIQGLHKNETGPKGCLLVEWTKREQQVQFVPTAPLVWENLSVDISEVTNVSELFEKIREGITKITSTEELLIALTLQANDDTEETIVNYVQTPEFKEQLEQQLNLPNVWLASVGFIFKEGTDRQTLESLYPKVWAEVLEQAAEPKAFRELTEGIFEQIPKKYLNEPLDEDYRRELLKQAIAKIYLN